MARSKNISDMFANFSRTDGGAVMKRVWAVVAILALLLAACGDDDDSGGGSGDGGGGSIRVALGDIESVETLARIIEEEEGIEFGEISYVPGAEVRATALLRGNLKAAVLDIPTKNFVMSEAPGKFHSLPTPETEASDEVLFGNTAWMEENEESLQVLLEEILTVWRSVVENPEFVVEERERLGLLPDLPAELEKELLPYYEQAAEEGLFTEDCGGEPAAKEDFEFYNAAEQLEGDPAELQVEDFWSLEPLESAVSSVEESGN